MSCSFGLLLTCLFTLGLFLLCWVHFVRYDQELVFASDLLYLYVTLVCTEFFGLQLLMDPINSNQFHIHYRALE